MVMTDLSAILISDTTVPSCGTIRWMSPELLDTVRFGSDGLPSRQSDCYALGMTIYEVSGIFSVLTPPFTHLQVLSGFPPFHHLRSPIVACAILTGERPGKLWGLLQSCWSELASARPTVRRLLDHLRPVSLIWVPPPVRCSTPGGVASAMSLNIPEVPRVSPSGSACGVQ